jgi:hypothetical protein
MQQVIETFCMALDDRFEQQGTRERHKFPILESRRVEIHQILDPRGKVSGQTQKHKECCQLLNAVIELR